VLDQLPVSATSAIEITPKELSGGVFNKDTGLVTWQHTLAPYSQHEQKVGFEVKYPKRHRLNIE